MADERTLLLNSKERQRQRRIICLRLCFWMILLLILAITVIGSTVAAFPYIFTNETDSTSETSTVPDTLNSEQFIATNQTLKYASTLEMRNLTTPVDLTVFVQKAGQIALAEKDRIEEYSPTVNMNSASYKHQKVIMATNEKARRLSRFGYQEDGALRFIGNNSILHFNSSTIFNGLCSNEQIRCNLSSQYRSFNGSCNNLIKPNENGVAYRMFRRALPADYDDGISKPRTLSKQTQPNGNHYFLPSARTVSLEVHRTDYKTDLQFTVMLAVWGQFLDHDITATALNQKRNGDTVACCPSLSDIISPECFPVVVEDPEDPLAELHNISCIEFIRSAPAQKCYFGSREQMNQVTAFIDGSVVYGVDESLVNSLRSMKNGLMKMYITEDNRTLLPVSYNMEDGCNRDEEWKKGRYCFLTGDARANENLHLTSMHLIWARQHNRLAGKLLELNPHWDDERLFQESRKIIGAQMQHVTYNEFLPILLGESIMSKHDLWPQQDGYFDKYNETLDATIANEFATAAFRFAHSIIPNLVKHLNGNSTSFIKMRQMLFDPFKLYGKGELNRALSSAIHTNLQPSDAYFANELKSHLFDKEWEQLNGKQCSGLDLVALNIQRGRDHGLAGYVHWLKLCGSKDNISNFDDLETIMDGEALRNIKAIYRNVEDIDLYTGALSEYPIKGSILGPTLTCIILDQFIRIKVGDRFWYETNQEPQKFSLDQLREIRKTSLAGILCKNADDELKSSAEIQLFIMKYEENNQNNVPCSNISELNLIYWKES